MSALLVALERQIDNVQFKHSLSRQAGGGNADISSSVHSRLSGCSKAYDALQSIACKELSEVNVLITLESIDTFKSNPIFSTK